MDELIVRKSIVKQAFITFMSLGLTALGAFFLYIGIEYNTLFAILFGIFILLIFGFFTFHHMKLLFDGHDLVILNNEGFYDYSSAISTKDQLIKWTDVRDIALTSIGGKLFVSIEVENFDELLKSQNAMSKKAMRLNNKIGYKDINITMQNAKGMDANDLVIIMQDYHAKYGNSINYEAGELKHLKDL